MKTCEVCGEMIPVNKDGSLRTHGPRKERCAGGRPSAPKSVEDKATLYIEEGRVSLEVASIIEGELQAAVAWVQGTAPDPYKVESNGIAWWCDCPAQRPECAHVVAVRRKLFEELERDMHVTARRSLGSSKEIDALFEGLN